MLSFMSVASDNAKKKKKKYETKDYRAPAYICLQFLNPRAAQMKRNKKQKSNMNLPPKNHIACSCSLLDAYIEQYFIMFELAF